MGIRQWHATIEPTAVLCFLSALCEGFDVQAAGVAATGLTHELHCASTDLGFFFSSSGLGLLIGSVVGGHIADRRGRKLVLVTSIGLFGAFSLLTSLMPSLPLLTGMRFVTGLGLGGALPNLIAMAVETSARGARNRSVGVAYFGMPIGGSLASIVAFILPSEAWREIFRVGGLVPLLIVPVLMYFLPGTRAGQLPADEADLSGDTPRRFAGKGRALQTLLLWLGFFLIVLTLHLLLNWLPYLLTARGLTKDAAMLAQAAFGIGGAVIALGQAAMLDSPRRGISILVSIGVLPLLLVGVAELPPWPAALILIALLLGGGVLAQQVIVYAAGSAFYPNQSRGGGLGAAIAAGRVGSLAGPMFAAALLANGQHAAQVLLNLLPIVLTCGVCVAIVSRILKGRFPAPDATATAHPG